MKLNQCKGVFIEDCTINGARDNAVDMVAVQVRAEGNIALSGLMHKILMHT